MQSRKLMLGLAVLAAFMVVDSALAYYNPSTGRFIGRDPIGEPGAVRLRNVGRPPSIHQSGFIPRDPASSEEPNTYAYVYNDPVRRIDALGLCCDKEDCEKKLQKALQDPRIQKMLQDAKKLKHWWGMPCFGRVRCTCLCGKGTLGWADPLSGDALVCANNSACISQSLFNDVVREEIAHQMLMCGNINDWLWKCSGCMSEEKRAKYLAGLCKTDRDCTRQAWSSCANHLGCKDKKWQDFIGVGWPPDTEGHKPY